MTWFELAGGAYTRIAEIGAAGNIVASGSCLGTPRQL